MDNIFIDSTKLGSSCTSAIVYGLSDHNVQFLTANNITTKVNLIPLKKGTRKLIMNLSLNFSIYQK
jgi:hypothetical protein